MRSLGVSVENSLAFDSSLAAASFDVGVFAVGYERRSSHAMMTLADRTNRGLAIAYQSGHTHSYGANLEWATSQDWIKVYPEGDDELNRIEYEIRTLRAEGREPLSEFIDVSSMTRFLMASMILRVFRSVPPGARVTIVYSPARFVDPTYKFSPVQ